MKFFSVVFQRRKMEKLFTVIETHTHKKVNVHESEATQATQVVTPTSSYPCHFPNAILTTPYADRLGVHCSICVSSSYERNWTESWTFNCLCASTFRSTLTFWRSIALSSLSSTIEYISESATLSASDRSHKIYTLIDSFVFNWEIFVCAYGQFACCISWGTRCWWINKTQSSATKPQAIERPNYINYSCRQCERITYYISFIYNTMYNNFLTQIKPFGNVWVKNTCICRSARYGGIFWK